MGRTPAAVDDRREQILDAALAVFAEKGFDRATNKDIARAAGITPGLIYHYFKNKEDVLVGALERHTPLKVVRAIAPASRDLPPEAFLRQFVRELLAVLENDRFISLLKVFLPEAMHRGNLSPIIFSAIGEATGFLEGYLRSKMEKGELRTTDAALVCHLLLGSLMDFVLRRQVLRDPAVARFSREQIVETVVSTLLQGLLSRPGAAR